MTISFISEVSPKHNFCSKLRRQIHNDVVIKLSVLSDPSDTCTFGAILKALLQDRMSDRSLKSLLNIAQTGKYDLSIDLSDWVEYEFSIYYNIGFETLS